jgi:hypothetical protein
LEFPGGTAECTLLGGAMNDLTSGVVDVLTIAPRPVTAREIALDVGRIVGLCVDRRHVECILQDVLRERTVKDACQRWRLACRSELGDTIPRRRAYAPADEEHPRTTAEQQKLWHQFTTVLSSAPQDPTRVASLVERLAKCGPQVESLMQWAADLEVEKQRLQAEIDGQHGCAFVWVLYKLPRRKVTARVVNGPRLAEWELLDGSGRATGDRVPYRPFREVSLQQRGYLEVSEKRPAIAMIVFGRSGANWPRVEAVIKPAVIEAKSPAKPRRRSRGNEGIQRLFKALASEES